MINISKDTRAVIICGDKLEMKTDFMNLFLKVCSEPEIKDAAIAAVDEIETTIKLAMLEEFAKEQSKRNTRAKHGKEEPENEMPEFLKGMLASMGGIGNDRH